MLENNTIVDFLLEISTAFSFDVWFANIFIHIYFNVSLSQWRSHGGWGGVKPPPL